MKPSFKSVVEKEKPLRRKIEKQMKKGHPVILKTITKMLK